jgi:hypothetical protein
LKTFTPGFQDTVAKTAPGGASAKALGYALKRWPALIRYADTGYLPIDNNTTENCIRPIALGRLPWAEKIIFSLAPNGPASGLPPFKVCSEPPSSMVLIRPLG